jgi:hypothetical protein
MDRFSPSGRAFATGAFLLAALALAAAAPAAAAPGYLWLQAFSANAATSGQVALSGQFVNECTAKLPPGTLLRILFDQGTLLDVTITAGRGQTQQFSGTVLVPQVPPPKTDATAYRFEILLPGDDQVRGASAQARPDMKTSPCLVTPAPGTPSEP